jgi:hypothetical protein
MSLFGGKQPLTSPRCLVSPSESRVSMMLACRHLDSYSIGRLGDHEPNRSRHSFLRAPRPRTPVRVQASSFRASQPGHALGKRCPKLRSADGFQMGFDSICSLGRGLVKAGLARPRQECGAGCVLRLQSQSQASRKSKGNWTPMSDCLPLQWKQALLSHVLSPAPITTPPLSKSTSSQDRISHSPHLDLGCQVSWPIF